MLLLLVSYFGGALTIVSPCILPILPFVFARANQPFVRSTLPLLLGMAITFAAVATLAAVGGGWAVRANQYGRAAAIVLLALFGITLLFPGIADRLTRPLVAFGARLSQSASAETRGGSSIWPSFLLGIATGLLWAPCAGPILGLLLTGAAIQGANVGTSLLLLAYAAGAATSLALALVVGGRVFAVMKRSLGVGEWVRRGLGVAVLAGVAAIAFGLDTGVLAKVSLAGTTRIEQALIEKIHPEAAIPAQGTDGAEPTLAVEGDFPSFAGAVEWLNSAPLTPEQLRGKVVLVDFWTYSCINCLRTLPYVRAWAEKYRDQGLVVIGVHTPEFAFEKDAGNVKKATETLQVGYPVALDNDFAVWHAFNNQYWPAHYFIDASGKIRHHHFGEGRYDESERVIQRLLAEAGQTDVPASLVSVAADGAEAAPDNANMRSPETYLGFERAENFASPGGAVRGLVHAYDKPPRLDLNQWALHGNWTIEGQKAIAGASGVGISYRFHARDLHLVLGPGTDGKPVRFRVTVDGKAPAASRGSDIDEEGNGEIKDQRLYQLVRQSGDIGERDFEIEFLDPGAQVFAFTFG